MKPNNHPTHCSCQDCRNARTKAACEKVRGEVSAMPPEERARLESVAREKIGTPPPSDPLGVAAVTPEIQHPEAAKEWLEHHRHVLPEDRDHALMLAYCDGALAQRWETFNETATPTREPAEGATPLTTAAEFMWKSIPGCDQRMMVEPEFARALEIRLSQAKEANRLGLAFHLKQTAALETALAEAKAQLAEALGRAQVAEGHCIRKDEINAEWVSAQAGWKEKESTLRAENERLAALVADLEKDRTELREIRGCVDWGAISSGRATALSEVQRTITALREAQHAADQQRIRAETAEDQLAAAQAQIAVVTSALQKLDAIYRNELDEPATRPDWLLQALSPSCGAELLATESPGMQLARREIDSALHYLPQEYVIQHEDPFAAMVLTFNRLAHAIKGLTARNAKLEGDAERIDWLSAQGFCFRNADKLFEATGDQKWKLWVIGPNTEWSYNEAREVIDAARQAIDSEKEDEAMPSNCPNCHEPIVEGAQIYTCDACGCECCTPCSDNVGDGLMCLSCIASGKAKEGGDAK